MFKGLRKAIEDAMIEENERTHEPVIEAHRKSNEKHAAKLAEQRANDPDGLTKKERHHENLFAALGSVEVFASTTGDTFTYRAAFDGRILEDTEPDRSRYLTEQDAQRWGKKRVMGEIERVERERWEAFMRGER